MVHPREQSRLLRYNQVAQMLNLSKSTIRRMERDGDFPRSFSIGSRAVAFDRVEVMEWIRKKKNENRAA
jgi:prophage regulatory protein